MLHALPRPFDGFDRLTASKLRASKTRPVRRFAPQGKQTNYGFLKFGFVNPFDKLRVDTELSRSVKKPLNFRSPLLLRLLTAATFLFILFFLLPQYAVTATIDTDGKVEGEQTTTVAEKLIFANGSWYAISANFDSIFFQKSEDGTNWGDTKILDTEGSPFAPSAIVKDDKLYVVWLHDEDNTINVNTIDIKSGSLGTQCTTSILPGFSKENADGIVSTAVSDDGTVYTAVGGEETKIVLKLDDASSNPNCEFLDITPVPGIVLPYIYTIKNTLHLISGQDNTHVHMTYDAPTWTTKEDVQDTERKATIVRNEVLKNKPNGEWSFTKDGQKLILDDDPKLIYNEQGQIIGIDALIRLFKDGEEQKVDPHRISINPPLQIPDENNPDNFIYNPYQAYQQWLWDTVTDTPNPAGWRTRGTVTTVYATAPGGVGKVHSTHSVYASARTGASPSVTSLFSPSDKHVVGQDASNGYRCFESFLIFDTSGLPDTDNIDDVVLSLDGNVDWSTTDFNVIAAPSDYDGGPVVVGDWISGADLAATTTLASWNSSGYSATYNAFTSVAAFLTAINKTGNTPIILYSDRHSDGTAPTDLERVEFTDADASGTTTDPKLDITHAASNQNPNAPSSLGPTSLVDGSFGADNTPTPTFTLSDPDAADTVKFQIQIDDTSDFSSAVVDYTSALAAQGSTSFTVGQAASGSYTTGSEGQTLSDGSYYWRVKAIDNSAAESAYSTANSGAIAFKVDTAAPSVSVTAFTPDPTTDTTPSITGTATDSTTALSAIQFQVDSTSGSWSTCTADDGTIDETSETFTCTTATLSDGSHTIYVRATDSAANTTALANYGTDTFTVDTGAPSVSLTAISPDPGTDTTPTISGTATDATGTISTVQFQVDSTSGSWTTCTADDGSFNEVSESFACTTTVLSDGSHTIYVRATDNNSNTSSNVPDAFTVDTTAPVSIDLDGPGNNSYTNSERPTFKWKATTDATAGLSKYVLEIDNPSIGSSQPSGDFTVDSIPTSRTTDYETNKYVIHYENFSDSDSSNNYISVYTKSHSDWGSSENDGKLREGRVSWKVKAVDNAGNETSSSRTLFVDRTNPKVEFTQVNEIPFTSTNFSTTDKTPTIFGKITDSLAGGDSSQTQDENGPKIASGPKQVDIKVEKKEGLLYKLRTLYTINMDKPWYACDNKEVSDNSKQKCDKYLPFEFTSKENLTLGQYKITLTGKDKADNTSFTSFTLNITTFAQITTPEEKKIIEKEIKELPKEEQEKIKEELEITKPTETPKPNIIQETGEKAVNAAGSFISAIFTGIGNGVKFVIGDIGSGLAFIGNTIGNGYNTLADNAPGFAKNILLAAGNTFNNATAGTGKGIANLAFFVGEKTDNVSHGVGTAIIKIGYLFVPEPTKISNTQVAKSTPNSMTITWETNHPASGKVNYGLTADYGQDVQSDKRTTQHEFTITGLASDTTYHYEVMSQNRNYVYDANHTFTTPKE
ncbi:hypothetical protein A2409_03755 [Candidatus Curtissbacteria bacterium RIFOXYC1_FULL_41_36]|uniref:Fibronectin type-III domain-containing protein n=1 Tax=Candidatus Woesebacteria bacterium GW2011_GWA1_41_13b TaxID=1618555 RepID=A0A0G0X3I9_9BACT|nr:MAG: hypothetical protein UU42_C0018G0003 [Candidatus Woesebacteria bacterium GW2011_GWA1_41_13b]OGE15280.1 MAG: hypothetical protein A2409_03755 [Candidatus Curtissbacteria bacterium RIFOXYC1_FULL_41_36]